MSDVPNYDWFDISNPVKTESPHPQTIDTDASVDIAVSAITNNSVKLVKMVLKDRWARELIKTMVQQGMLD